MNREVVLEVGREEAVARLLEEKAPKTCDLIWKNLPLEGPAIHAKIAGPEFWFMVPLFQDEIENPAKEQEAGNICFWSIRQTIPIFYERVSGIGLVNLWAKITENLEGIRREGRKIWIKQGLRVRINKRKD
jgi:hypothetical protein